MKLAAALLLALTLPAVAEPWEECRGGHRAERRLTCVVDGDTFWVDGVKYRLERVDAPEIRSPDCTREQYLGWRAMWRLAELLGSGAVDLRPTGEVDRTRDRRPLVNPTAAGLDVQDILLREGLALPYTPGGRRMRAAHWCGGVE